MLSKHLETLGFETFHPQLDALICRTWVNVSAAEKLFQQALHLPWQYDSVLLLGKTITTRRKMIWIADQPYHYAGKSHSPRTWPSWLASLKINLVDQLKYDFNSVLGNYYHDGTQSMGYHRDNEAELGHDPVIASLSLGVTRPFKFKHLTTGETIDLTLPSGSLLIMYGNSQANWKHSLPKRINVKEPRINFTFRYMHQQFNHKQTAFPV